MYRLAHNPGNSKIIVELVSDQLIDCIETIFGPLNVEGHFSDINRIKEFMIRSEYLKDLVKETYSSGTGLLASKISWIQIIKNRYEDILCKIKDQKHEYTFNEVGEGLIYLIFNFFSNCDYDYLLEYENTNDVFDEYGLYFTMLERKDYPGLREALIQAGRNAFDDVVIECEDDVTLEIYKENPNHEEWARKEFSEYYEDIWYSYFSSISNFGFGGYLYSDLFETMEVSSYSELAERWNDIIISDVVFWDDDFLFVLPLLNDKKAINKFVKNCGNYLGYKINSADMAVLSTDDTASEI